MPTSSPAVEEDRLEVGGPSVAEVGGSALELLDNPVPAPTETAERIPERDVAAPGVQILEATGITTHDPVSRRSDELGRSDNGSDNWRCCPIG